MKPKLILILIAIFAMLGAANAQKTITIGMNELPSLLDPPKDWAIASTWIHMNMFDCLVWRNRETAEFEPWLAESWENVDETTWRMNLREGVTFHNGEPFTADAVKFTYERITSASRDEFITFNQWTFITDISILGPYEVEFTTETPEPAFLSKMAGTGCGIQAPVAGAENDAADTYEPIGTGPYKFVDYVRDDVLTLEANADYWQGTPDIGTILWRALPETSTRIANLLTGDVDLVVGVPPQDWDRINSNEGTVVQDYLTTRVMLLALRAGPSEQNPDWEGLTSDVRIRQAISYAIDRGTLVDVINGMGIPVLSRITPPTLGWSEDQFDQVGTYDPELAQQLLSEAGYDGEELTFHSSTSWLLQKEVAEVIEAMLESVGLNVDLQVMDVTTFREQIYFPYKNEEIYMDALGNSFFDPWITVLSERSDRRERSGWSGETADQVDQLVRAAAVNMDPEVRAEQYVEITSTVLEEAVSIPLYQMKDAIGKTESLEWDPPLDGFLWMGNAVLGE
ncbi:MAG: ABC transporter substrate-binding protein [Deinococcota bacterium]